jgi:3-phenylpropionate/trans-cinnamate dioxygenase ferredoxin reductase component
MGSQGIVIVGAGESGARAAIELRNQGYSGTITMIGKGKQTPYELPPLSKNVLVTEDEPSPTYILDDEKLSKLDIQLLSDSAAVKLDREKCSVFLEDGRQVGYERLLLATGASPRKLALEGSDLSGALYLRSFSDALAIRSRLHPGNRVVVIGGGFIGLEVAASARQRGCGVTLLEVGPRILMRGVPEAIANIVEARHRAAGVVFKLGVGIERVDSSNNEHRIALADGTVIECDTLIVGIGAIPETSLAAECGLEVNNGICADERLATSDPNIFVAGDCCSFPHRLYDGKRIRLEAWRNAQDQGIHAAGSILGASAPYEAVPWFWSDQYDLTLQVTGLVDAGAVTVKRESGDGNHLFFHLNDQGRLVAASGIGPSIAKDIRIAEMLIQRQAAPELTQLADPVFKLKALLQA